MLAVRVTSTNVRSILQSRPAAAVLAGAMWAGFVAALAASGALERLAGDVPALAAFVSSIAALAWAVDTELRRSVDAIAPAVMAAVLLALAGAMETGSNAMILVALPL